MTTFQDPQPQSRRAVRQGERGDSPEPQFPAAPPQYFAEPDSMWDTNARRAAQLPAAPRPDAAATGRRAAAATPPPAAAEPLNYSTASRQPQVPSYDPQSFRTRLDAREAQAAAESAQSPEQGFRVRDFSPEGRRAAPFADSAPVAPVLPVAPPSADLDYQTEVREGFGEPQAPVAPPAPISSVPPQYAVQQPQQPSPVAAPPVGLSPLTAPQNLQQPPAAPAPSVAQLLGAAAQQPTVRQPIAEPHTDQTPAAQAPIAPAVFAQPQVAPAPSAPAPIAQAPVAQTPVTPTPVAQTPVTPTPAAQPATTDTPGHETISRRELRARQETAGSPTPTEPVGPPELIEPAAFRRTEPNAPSAWQIPAPVQQPEAPVQQAPVVPQPAAPAQQQAPVVAQPEAAPAPQAAEATRAPEAIVPAPQPTPAAETVDASFDALLGSQQADVNSPISLPNDEGAVWTPPVGHWSTQADVDDEVPEPTINRRVGSGSTMTNALVLPSIPLGSDIRGPLTSTGEIMLTGSIDLPHSLSSTGTSDRIDHSGIDSLFDLSDHEVITTDSQPVRAIRAVSTHQTGGVTHTQKPKGTRALTVLLISASAMAVVVAGLLVAAFAFNIF